MASKQADVVSRRWEGKKRKEREGKVKCREEDTPRTDKLARDNFSGGEVKWARLRSFVAANFFGK